MKAKAQELAKFLGAQLEGDGDVVVTGIASPEGAGERDLIYVDAAKHAARAAASRARCVLAAPGIAVPGKTVLRVAQPKLAFARAAARLLPEAHAAEAVHPTAVIDPTARLAAGVSVGPYAVIGARAEVGAGSEIGAFCCVGRDVRIGSNCRLYPHVVLYPGARLGHRVVVHAGAVIGSDGFGYVFAGERYEKFPQAGVIEIGDDVEIGAGSTLDRGALDSTRIGRGTKLDNQVHVAHNVTIGEHTVIAAQCGISGSVRIGNRCVLGGQVGVADHVTLEDGVTAGAKCAIITGKTVRAGQTVWGSPARPLDKFKIQHAWFARLPELAARIKKLEEAVTSDE